MKTLPCDATPVAPLACQSHEPRQWLSNRKHGNHERSDWSSQLRYKRNGCDTLLVPMRRALLISMLLPFLAVAADQPNQFPYCENMVQPVAFNAQGTWVITGVAAYSHTSWLQRKKQERLIGSQVRVRGRLVDFWRKRVRSPREPFPTPLINQQTYDTRSREFWLDFRTDPAMLDLPRYVSAVDVELGTVVGTAGGRTYFNYSGVWFTLSRAAPSQPSGNAGPV